MNELEKLLLSWTPRRPSKELEQRLFGPAVAAAEEMPSFRLGWLAPAAVAALLLCVLLNGRGGAGLTGTASGGPMFAAIILSNQSAAAYLTGAAQSEQNNLPAVAFKWTRSAHVTVPLSAISPGKRED